MERWRTKIFADGADLKTIRELSSNPLISGFTTNPTLARKAGVQNYESFARLAADAAHGKPISLEVIADDFPTMTKQALNLSELGNNIYVKIPVTTTDGQSTAPVIAELLKRRVPVNVTAVFTPEQIVELMRTAIVHQEPNVPRTIVSVFAGRVADAGIDPQQHMVNCLNEVHGYLNRPQLLWASPRQVYDLVLADRSGCDIITMTPALLDKISSIGKDLSTFSLETVRMFRDDAVASGFEI